MLLSFLVYGFMGFCFYVFGIIASKREHLCYANGNKISFFTWEVIFPILLFSLISGVRWNVGADHLSYLEEYKRLLRGNEFSREEFEKGFYQISLIFATLKIHFVVYFGFLAFLQIFLVYYSLRDQRFIFPYLGLIIIFGGQYLIWMNGIRQTIAACFFVYSIRYINNKDLFKYLITIFLASLFHKSALILIFFFFLPKLDYLGNRTLTTFTLILSVILGASPEWLVITDWMDMFVKFIGYDYTNIAAVIEETAEPMGIGPRRIITILLCLILIYFSPQLKRQYAETSYLIYYNLTIAGVIYFNLFASTSHLLLRPTYYLLIFMPISLSFLLHYLSIKRKYSYSYLYIFLFVFILSISYLIISIIATTKGTTAGSTNYNFFWDHI